MFIKFRGDRPNYQLVEAIRSYDIEKAKRAIDQGANVNFKGSGYDGASSTVLEVAIRRGDPEMVALLLGKGADPLSRGRRSGPGSSSVQKSPFDQSIEIMLQRYTPFIHDKSRMQQSATNQKYIISLLKRLNTDSSYHPIIPALLTGDLEEVKRLVKKGGVDPYDRNVLRATMFSLNKEIIDFALHHIFEFETVKIQLLPLAIESQDQKIIDYVLGLPGIDINK